MMYYSVRPYDIVWFKKTVVPYVSLEKFEVNFFKWNIFLSSFSCDPLQIHFE